MKRLSALVLAALLCGCCTVTICKEGGHDMVEVKNSSWNFLGLALASGDPEYPNQDVSVWFCDSLLLDVNMMLLDDALRKHGYGSFRNISSYRTRESMLFIFSRETYRTSAELVR